MKQREITVAHAAELKDGEMKQVAAGERNILLARVNGIYHAVGATCPHYGAPLAEGALSGARIICPWHHARCRAMKCGLKTKMSSCACLKMRRTAGRRR
jgi:nitrite reductase/ring-hydroxylating ferredoxin subunit